MAETQGIPQQNREIPLQFFIEKVYDAKLQILEQKILSLEKADIENKNYIELLILKLEQEVKHNKKAGESARIDKAEEYKLHFERLNGEYRRIDVITAEKVSLDKFEGLAKAFEIQKDANMKIFTDLKGDIFKSISEKIENVNKTILDKMEIVDSKIQQLNSVGDIRKGSSLINEKIIDKIVYIVIAIIVGYLLYELKLK